MGLREMLHLGLVRYHRRALARLNHSDWYPKIPSGGNNEMVSFRPLRFSDKAAMRSFINALAQTGDIDIMYLPGIYTARTGVFDRIFGTGFPDWYADLPVKSRGRLHVHYQDKASGKQGNIMFTTGITGERPSTVVDGECTDLLTREVSLACVPIPRFTRGRDSTVIDPMENADEYQERYDARMRTRTSRQAAAWGIVAAVITSPIMSLVLKALHIG